MLFPQTLNESIGFFAGKLDMLDGDANALAYGGDRKQFLHTAFIANPMCCELFRIRRWGAA